MTTMLQTDLLPEGMKPVMFMDPAKGMPMTTVAASMPEEEATSKTDTSRLFGKTTTAPKLEEKPEIKNVYKELLKMLEALNRLALLVVQWHAKDQESLGLISDITAKGTHELTERSVETLKKQAEEAEKAKNASWWQKLGSRIVGLCGILLAGSPGAAAVALAMMVMEECGVFNKLGGLPAWAKVLILVGATLAAGQAAKGVTSLVTAAKEAATKGIVAGSAKAAATAGAESAAKATAAAASANMGAALMFTQILSTSNLTQDAVKALLGDNEAAEWISFAINFVLCAIAMYCAGGASFEQLGDSPNLLKMMKVAGFMLFVGSVIQCGAGIANAQNYKEMEKTENRRAVEESGMIISKSTFHMVQTLMEQLNTITNDLIKRFETSYRDFDSISRPWEVTAAALAGRI